MKYVLIVPLIILLLSHHTVIGQDKFLELSKLSLEEKEISLKIKDIQKQLTHFINEGDTLNIANAYYVLSNIKTADMLSYTDSIIDITKNKKYFKYPALGFFQKGNISYQLGNSIEALQYYIKASDASKENGNDQLYISVKFSIGLLKNESGDREESQIIFKDYVTFLEQNPKYKSKYNYNPGLFALADSYIHTGDMDLAKTTIDKGIKETLKTKDSTNYAYILSTSGVHQFLINNYQKAIDSLEKGKKLIKKIDSSETRIATCDYYIGRSYQGIGNEEKSILHFKKVDTILKKTKDIIPEVIDVYDHLGAYAKSKNDYPLQIEYINTQLKLDSIRHANQVYLTRNITRKYDTVELIAEKEKLIKQYQKNNFSKNNIIILLLILLTILVLITVYGLRKSYLNKIRFQKLLEQQKTPKVHESEIEKVVNTDLVRKDKIDIPADVIENILIKIHDFESNNQFVKKHYTLNSLAKELHTNSAYLSKIINAYKNVNFANYLNNLRIDFAVEQLSSNKALRSYTIQAIAEEVGFKNAQSFSSAFYKKTGIYPSYFIKKINN